MPMKQSFLYWTHEGYLTLISFYYKFNTCNYKYLGLEIKQGPKTKPPLPSCNKNLKYN